MVAAVMAWLIIMGVSDIILVSLAKVGAILIKVRYLLGM
jgi:hypothetical protein